MATPSETESTIEEALEQTHFGKFNYLIILFTGLTFQNVVFECMSLSFALPLLECELVLSHNKRGILCAICFIGMIVCSHFWGFMADTMGRKSIMRPALFVGFAITTVSSFSPNFESLMVLRFLTGCALAAPASIAYSYLGEFHDQKYRNRAILSASFITAFLVIFFPIYAWAFINMKWKIYIPILNIMYKPWRLYIMVCGFTGLMCGIGLTFLPESPKYLLAKGKPENAIEVLKYMHHVNTKHFKALSKVEFKIHTSVCIQHLEISTFHHSIALETIAAILLLINSYAIGKLGSKTILCKFFQREKGLTR
ncbi:synaptic vesicle glycoprotein 2B-like [Teleopsis dalmanni]|uniref:synaptic vesicle glycoprotein 2B-like n=1 Tax=Teleopsis dalmanni TaxID=139649 RepID=UPI0018CE0BE0|nr:synaptic vesicle glycoprotein 2B-like [Teleopsis dalmanni]